MQLIWTILRWLFPTDPVQQCIGAARHRIALMASQVFTPQSLFLLEHDPQARLYIEALVIDYEFALHMAIGARACQIAKLRFRMHPRNFYKPTRALNVAALLKRIRALVTMCNNIERLAQIRAERLKREHDADPLPLHATSPAFGEEELSSLAEGGGGGARALARVTEGAGRNAAGLPRAPPIFDVQLKPKPASQAHLRERDPMAKRLEHRARTLAHFPCGARVEHVHQLFEALARHVDARRQVVVLENLLDLAGLHRAEHRQKTTLVACGGERIRVCRLGLGLVLEHDIAAQRLDESRRQLGVRAHFLAQFIEEPVDILDGGQSRTFCHVTPVR
jgi:hypothetical protein